MDVLFETRRKNVSQLVLEKFAGNRSAFSRACEVHHNHINLLLSNNEQHRRNLGEGLARRIEEALSLPTHWLDQDHSNDDTSFAVISSMPIDGALSRVLKTPYTASMTISTAWIRSQMPEVSGSHMLFLSAIATSEVEPDLAPGDMVLIDSGVKAYTIDGIYLLTSGDGTAYLRRVRKQLTGGFSVSGGGDTATVESLAKLPVLGRIAQKIQACRI